MTELKIKNEELKIDNPFIRLRVRSLLLWVLVSCPVLLLLKLSKDSTWELGINLSWFYGVILLWMIVQFRRKGISFRLLMGRIPSIGSFLKMLGIVIVLLFFSFGTIFLSEYLVWVISPSFAINMLRSENASVHTSTPALYTFFSILGAMMLAPIIEELLFRGFLLHRLSTKWGVTKAILIAALLFGLFHADIIGKLTLAIVMSLIYIRKRNLYLTMFGHFMNNLLPTIFILNRPDTYHFTPPSASDFQSFLVLGGISLLFSTPVVVYIVWKYWPRGGLEVLPYFQNMHELKK